MNQLIWGQSNKLITKFSGDPNYSVKRKESKFHGYSIEDLKRARYEILRRRGELPPQPAQSPLDDASWEGETEGSGLGEPDADELIHQLYVSLGSIRAGNTSTKLQKQVVDLLKLLYKHGMINEFQRKNPQRLYKTMIFNLLLDSSLAKQQRNNHNQKSHDFPIYFNPPIELDREKKTTKRR